jgi:hypothetical protein
MFEQWTDLNPAVTGIQSAMLLRPNEILRTVEIALAGQCYLEWARYAAAAELHRQLDADVGMSDFLADAYAGCAARLAAAQQLSQASAEHHLTCALALRDRLPRVAEALKHGFVAPHHISAIVSRTDLIEGGDHTADIDREIAENLRRRGSWSKKRMRDMVDAIIFRRDPDLVREDRKDALNNRGVWADNTQNGMGHLSATFSAEDTAMIMQRLEKLAASTCKRDPRTKPQRMSDALFAITMAREFTCTCPDDPDHPCTATIITVPADGMISGIDARIVLHAIANRSTLDGSDYQPGYLDGHGVITGDHARGLADHDSTTVRLLGNGARPASQSSTRAESDAAQTDAERSNTTDDAAGPAPTRPDSDRANLSTSATEDKAQPCPTPPPSNRKTRRATKTADMSAPPDSGSAATTTVDWDTVTPPDFQVIPLPTVKPGDHYRPSAVLDAYLRIRDCYCTWPGCDQPAFTADLDHTTEYDHANPQSGGRTHPTGMKTLCRFHHLLKTHTDWLDDQHADKYGRTTTIITTPEGRTYDGPAWTGEDLFPALSRIVWHNTTPGTHRHPPDNPTRTRSRTQAKYQRRQQERERNRRQREDSEDPAS